MARLVVGTSANSTTPALVAEKQPVISSLNITPTTSAQTIRAPQGTDGYSPVNVSAVTSSIDANITAGNIKKDVTILGVTGSYEGGGGSATQHGVNIKGWCGDIGSNGYIRTDQAVGTLSMPNLTYIWFGMFNKKFSGSTGLTGAVDLHSVVNLEDYGLYQAFQNTRITSIDLRSLNDISKYGMYQCCKGVTTLTSADIGASYLGEGGLKEAFAGTGLVTLAIHVSDLQLDAGDELSFFGQMCQNCSSLTDIYFDAIEASALSNWFDWFNDPQEAFSTYFDNMIYGCTNVTVHFVDNLADDLVNEGWFTSTQDVVNALLQGMDSNYATSGNSIAFDAAP